MEEAWRRYLYPPIESRDRQHSAINEAEVLGQVAEPDGMQSKVEMETSRVKFLGA